MGGGHRVHRHRHLDDRARVARRGGFWNADRDHFAQSMQTVVNGSASRRPSAMAALHSPQVPYVPFSRRASADRISRISDRSARRSRLPWRAPASPGLPASSSPPRSSSSAHRAERASVRDVSGLRRFRPRQGPPLDSRSRVPGSRSGLLATSLSHPTPPSGAVLSSAGGVNWRPDGRRTGWETGWETKREPIDRGIQ
jgi:hypothetical protein